MKNRPYHILFLCIFWVLIAALALRAQSDSAHPCVNIADLKWTDDITDQTGFFIDGQKTFQADALPHKPFSYHLLKYRRGGGVPNNWISSDIYMKLSLFNPFDTVIQLYFSPGYYFTKFQSYRETKEGKISLNDYPVSPFAREHGYTLLRVPPADTTVFYFKLKLLKSNTNHIACFLCQPDFLRQRVLYASGVQRNINLVTYIICGFMLMMLFYSLANFRQTAKSEFLFYSVYVITVFTLLFLKTVLVRSTTLFSFFFEGYFDFFIQLFSFYLYLAFIRKFLSTKEKYRLLDAVLSFSQSFLIVVFLAYTITYFNTDNLFFIGLVENGSKVYMLALGIFFIAVGLRYRDMLMKYMVMGNIALVGFGLISLTIIITNQPLFSADRTSLLNNALFHYDTGLCLESIFFLMGLSYKNKKDIEERIRIEETLKLENERKEMEKHLAVMQAQQAERNRISADMHDELGAGMTAIRLTSELAMRKYESRGIPELEKISNSSNDLLNNMNAIIWSMNTSNDKLETLASYIRSYALEYFDNSDIKCSILIPDQVPDVEVNGEKRRNIFLSIKEALNNILKHSGATTVIIEFVFGEMICIQIKDNGSGIDIENIRPFGNGLKNMERRMTRIDGTFEIRNGDGAAINFCIPY